MEQTEIIARLAHQYSTTKDIIRRCIKDTRKTYATLPESEILTRLQYLIPCASDGTYPPLPMSPVKTNTRRKKSEMRDEVGECFSCYNPIFETNSFPPLICVAAKDPKDYRDPLKIPLSDRETRYVVICPSCECKVCVKDLEGYYISNKIKPMCVNGTCGTEFDVSVLKRYIPSSHLPKFKKILKTAIYEEQLSQLPLTEASIAVSGYSTLGTTRLTITGEIAARAKNADNKVKLKKLPVKCLIDGCSGVLDNKWICEKCNKKKCKKCREYKADKKHVCNPYILSLIEEEKKTGCTCPQCGEIWQKTTGCDHMWCISCHAHYNYVKGGVGKVIPKKEQTNPAWHEYQRTKKALKASKEGQINQEDIVIGECPQDNVFPDYTKILRCMYMLFGGYDEDAVYLLEGIERICTNQEVGFPTERYQEVIREDNVSMEREFIILARDQIKINIDAVMPQIHNLQGILQPLKKKDTFKGYIGTTIPENILDINSRTYKIEECNKLFKERAYRYYKRQLYARKYLDIANMFRASAIIIIRNVEYALQPVIDLLNYIERPLEPSEVQKSLAKVNNISDGMYYVPNVIIENKDHITANVIGELKSLFDLIRQTNEYIKVFCEAYGDARYPYINHFIEFYSPSNAHVVNNVSSVYGGRHSIRTYGTKKVNVLKYETWEIPAYVKKIVPRVEKPRTLETYIARKFESLKILIKEGKQEPSYLMGSGFEVTMPNDNSFLELLVDNIERVRHKLTNTFVLNFLRVQVFDETLQRKVDLVSRLISFSNFRYINIYICDWGCESVQNIDFIDLTNLVKTIASQKFKKINLRFSSIRYSTFKKLIYIIAKNKPISGKRSYVIVNVLFDRVVNVPKSTLMERIKEILGPQHKALGYSVTITDTKEEGKKDKTNVLRTNLMVKIGFNPKD